MFNLYVLWLCILCSTKPVPPPVCVPVRNFGSVTNNRQDQSFLLHFPPKLACYSHAECINVYILAPFIRTCGLISAGNNLFKIVLLEMTASIERRDATEGTFEGSVPLCVHSLLNFIENLHVKGFYIHHIVLMFLIKEIFTWNLCLIGKLQSERQSIREPDSNSSMTSVLLPPPSLALFSGHAGLRVILAQFLGILTLQELN